MKSVLARIVTEHNRELKLEVGVVVGYGVAATVVTTLIAGGLGLALGWVNWGLFIGVILGGWFAVGYLIIAALVAYLIVQPHTVGQRLGEAARDRSEFEAALSRRLGYPFSLQGNDPARGITWLLVGGPCNLLEAWGTMRRQRASDRPEILKEAAEAMVKCRDGLDMNKLHRADAILLLYQLGLIKSKIGGGGSRTILLSTRGQMVYSELADHGQLPAVKPPAKLPEYPDPDTGEPTLPEAGGASKRGPRTDGTGGSGGSGGAGGSR